MCHNLWLPDTTIFRQAKLDIGHIDFSILMKRAKPQCIRHASQIAHDAQFCTCQKPVLNIHKITKNTFTTAAMRRPDVAGNGLRRRALEVKWCHLKTKRRS